MSSLWSTLLTLLAAWRRVKNWGARALAPPPAARRPAQRTSFRPTLEALGARDLPSANLSGAWFDVTPEPLSAGQSFQALYAAQNTDAGSAGGFWVDFYLSRDSQINPSTDRLLGWQWVGGLPGYGSTGRLNKSLSLPGAGDPFWDGSHNYTVGMIVDSFG